jgi:hypothetical protein
VSNWYAVNDSLVGISFEDEEGHYLSPDQVAIILSNMTLAEIKLKLGSEVGRE